MSERRNIMLGTAGHVDHGKTALVKLLTGCETDRLDAEKQRGLTIELGFAPCTMSDRRIVGIVDVPGHVDFIRNMVAGAHGVDVVIFVIAADDSVMPQTREHMDLLTILGCEAGLVALTKIDLIDAELREMLLSEVRSFTAETFLADAPICPVSNVTGEGFDEFFAALNRVVDAAQPRAGGGRFRLWSERSFSVKGFGTVATGIPSAGEVCRGDTLEVLPAGRTARVRSLEVYGESSSVGRGGECVALNLSDIDADHVGRGTVLCRSGACRTVTMCEGELTLLDRLPSPLPDNNEVHLHVGTAEVMAKVAILDGGKHLSPGESRLVQLRLRDPLPLAAGDRFAIRGTLAGLAGGRMTTLGGGRVLDVSDIKLRRNRPWTIQKLSARRDALDDPGRWTARILRESPDPISPDELARRANLQPTVVAEILADLVGREEAIELGGRFLHAEAVRELAESVIEVLGEFHDANPLRQGLAPEELASGLGASDQTLAAALDWLGRRGRLEKRGNVLALQGHAAALSEADIAMCERIRETLKASGVTPPLPAELADQVNLDETTFDKFVTLLADNGDVLRLDEKVLVHPSAVERAKAVALELFHAASGFTTTEFRDALGVSRKYAVPLLDYLDSIKWTVRSANRRTPGSAAREKLPRH
ncbi:MAG: selenocysteine-specific translation elongation factor [Planctomycetota bacterium]